MDVEHPGEPILERWWERVIDARIAVALGLASDADEAAIAAFFRRELGLPPEGSTDPTLWARFLYSIELSRTGPFGQKCDEAELANNVVGWAVVTAGDPQEQRFGAGAWDRELGVEHARCDEILRSFAYSEVFQRLVSAGLVTPV